MSVNIYGAPPNIYVTSKQLHPAVLHVAKASPSFMYDTIHDKHRSHSALLFTAMYTTTSKACTFELCMQLMGPSGSGKTTLLTALSGRVPRCKGMILRGSVHINGTPLAETDTPIGYVPQEDMFYSQMTVRETLTMTAALRLPKNTTEEEREAAVEEVLTTLDLRNVEGTVVGDKKTRGVSGGEKKRLSIACELLSKPSLLFLDELTTGLDAFQSLKVLRFCSFMLVEACHNTLLDV
jgi:ABC-type cobalamin/Fe3+-siderophores transport system ATPase subunit